MCVACNLQRRCCGNMFGLFRLQSGNFNNNLLLWKSARLHKCLVNKHQAHNVIFRFHYSKIMLDEFSLSVSQCYDRYKTTEGTLLLLVMSTVRLIFSQFIVFYVFIYFILFYFIIGLFYGKLYRLFFMFGRHLDPFLSHTKNTD